MGTLKTISSKTKVKQALESASFNVEYNYEVEEGKVPQMITARAIKPPVEGQQPEPNQLMIDLVFYPSTNNLQVTVHNKPAEFDMNLINEVLDPVEEIIATLEV